MVPVKPEADVTIDICCHVGAQNKGGITKRTWECERGRIIVLREEHHMDGESCSLQQKKFRPIVRCRKAGGLLTGSTPVHRGEPTL